MRTRLKQIRRACVLTAMIAGLLFLESGSMAWRTAFHIGTSSSSSATKVLVDLAGHVVASGFQDGNRLGVVRKSDRRDGAALWTYQLEPTGGPLNQIAAIALDPSGDVVAAGAKDTDGNNSLDSPTLVRLHRLNGSAQWRTQIIGSSFAELLSVTVDSAGDVVASGRRRIGTTLYFFVVKVGGADGTILWTADLSGSNLTAGSMWANAVRVNAAGDVYAGGVLNNGSDDFSVVKLDGSTGAQIWRANVIGPSADRVNSLELDGDGNVVAAGTTTFSADGFGQNFTVAKFDGATGAPLWRRAIDATSSPDEARALAVDAAGDVVAAGSIAIPGHGQSDFVTIKLRGSDGAELWRQTLNGTATNSFDTAFDVRIDAAGDAVAVGQLGNSATFDDFVVVKFHGATAVESWRAQLDGTPSPGFDSARAAAIDGAGNVVAVGQLKSGSTTQFSVVKLNGSNGSDFFEPYTPPVALDGAVATDEDVSVTGVLSATDADGQPPATFSLVRNGTKGTAVLSNAATGEYIYTPNANAFGPDSFTFVGNDGRANSNEATISVTINAVPDAPVASGGPVAVTEDTAYSGILTAVDADGDLLTFTLTSVATKGRVTITDPSTGAFVYVPYRNATGPDVFSFAASDGALQSNVAGVSITIDTVNDAPVAHGQTLFVVEDTSRSITLAANDVESGAVGFSLASAPVHGTLTGTAPDLTYTPDRDYNGSDNFSFRVFDGSVYSTVATVSLSVMPSLWTTSGPEGGDVTALAIDPHMPAVVYAGTQRGGVFKSTNGGANWAAINSALTNLTVRALAVNPAAPSTVYVATSAGVFKSVDYGATWTAANSGLSTVFTIAIDRITPTTVYAGTSAGVFKSINEGNSWSSVSTGLPVGSIPALAIDPFIPTILYAGTNNGGIYKSTDGGATWAASNGGLTSLAIRAIGVDPVTPSTMYAVTATAGVFKSTNAGLNWIASTTGLPPGGVAIAIDPLAPTTVYVGAGGGGGLFRSTNAGTTWSDVNPTERTTALAIAIDPATPTTVYAGMGTTGNIFVHGTGGVRKSLNSGASWSATNAGLTNFAVNGVAIAPGTPTQVYAATEGGGVFKSTGSVWTAINNGLTNSFVNTVAVDPMAGTTVYAGTGFRGVFKSTSGGTSWTSSNTGLTSLNVDALAIDPLTGTTLYAGTIGGGVFKSTDAALSWAPSNIGLTNSFVRAIAIDPVNPSTLYVGTDAGVFKSTTAAQDWSASSAGLTNLQIRALAIDSATPNTIYVGTSQGAFKSTDGGANWIAINSGLPSPQLGVAAIAVSPAAPSVYIATNVGVFRSANAGLTWHAENKGLDGQFVNALAMSPDPASTLYAATLGGGVASLMQSLNDAPNASHQNVSTTEDTAAAIVLAASDPDGQALTLAIVDSPAHGILSGTAPSLTYTPAQNYHGPDSFTFTASDGTDTSNVATVSIAVAPVNDPPVAADDSYITRAGISLDVAAPGVLRNDADIDATALRVVLVNGPTNGSFVLNDDGSFSYTPISGFSGSDSFTYRIDDNGTFSNSATVSLHVVANVVLWGTVTDRTTGAPIVGATVFVYGGGLASVQTDATGHYSVSGQQYPYSNGQLFVSAPGYYSVQNIGFSNAPTSRDFSLLPGGSVLRGTVRDSVTGAPVANASVSYGGTNTFQFGAGTKSATTDASGVYVFDSSQFAEGAATQGTNGGLSVTAQGYLSANANVSATAPFPAVRDFDLISANQTIIEGTVTDRTTGAPIVGATVFVYGGGLASVQTDATGHYSVSGQQYPYSNGQLFVSAPGYYSVQNIGFSNAPTSRDFSLLPGGSVLRGTVRDSVTGAPVANAFVSYGGTNTFQFGAGTKSATTDASGVYVFDSSQFAEGAATQGTNGGLSVTAQGYLSANANVSATAPFPAVRDFDLISANQTIIEGTVTDRTTGAPIVGATVFVYGGGLASVQTDATGHYSVSGQQYPYSNGQLFVSAPGYYSVQNIGFSNAPTSRDFSLLPGGSVLRGTVRDSVTGAPVANAFVSYGGTNTFQFGAGTKSATTDASGVYVFDSSQFAEGAATQGTSGGLSVDAPPGYVRGTTSVSALPAFPRTYNFDLEPTGATVSVVIQASVAGLPFQVDGVDYTAPQTFTWVPGNPHSVATVAEQPGGNGSRYVFRSWSDGGGLDHTIVAPASTATYTANFATQYLVTTSANPINGGVVTSGGWFDAGTTLQVSATAADDYAFSGFSGDLTGTNNPQILILNGPKSVTASFVLRNQPPVAELGPDRSGSVGVAVGFDAGASSDADGSIVSYEWSFGDGQSSTTTSATTTHVYAAAGPYTVTVTITDDDGATDSDTVLVDVGRGTQPVLTVNAPASLTYGNTTTLSATGGSGMGAVIFSAGSSSGCSVSGAVLSVVNASGTCAVTASKDGDTNYVAVTSAAVPVALQKAPQAALNVNAPASLIYGTTANLGVTGGSGTGAVTFTHGASTGCAIAAAVLSVTNAGGNCTVTASKEGDDNYLGPVSSPSVGVALVRAGTLTAVSSAPNPSSFTQAVTITATVSPVAPSVGTPTGTVQFFDGSVALGTAAVQPNGTATLTTGGLSPGVHSLTASYGGDVNFNSSGSGPYSHTVQNQAASTQTSLSASPSPSALNQAVVITAVVNPISGSARPTGTVNFFDGGVLLGSAPLVRTGGTTRAQLTVSTLTLGSHTLTAQYGGDGTLAGSTSSPLGHTVYQGTAPTSTTTTVTTSPNPSAPGQTVTLTAAVTARRASPTGTVLFYVDGVAVGSAVTNASGQATLQVSGLALGNHLITAQYTGSATFASSTGTWFAIRSITETDQTMYQRRVPMLSKTVGAAPLALAMALTLVVGAGAKSTYSISVNLDETTRGDMDMVSTTVQNAAVGSEVQRSLRRLANGAAGELALLASQRVDSLGNLRLDDGSTVALMEGDEVIVSASGDPQKRVQLIREPCTTGHCSMKPSAILIALNGGGCRLILLFAHPPVVQTCS